jgi:hypothetical protein
MGRRRDGNHSSQKNNLIQDSEGNEEKVHPLPDPNKAMITNTKESSDIHTQKKPSKKKS